MKTRTIELALAVFAAIAFSGPMSVAAEADAEVKAKAAYEAAKKTAAEAEAAAVPLRAAMQKADAAYAKANKDATAKRQKANRAKELAGEPGVKELKSAEDAVPAAVKTLEDATKAKPLADKALTEAKAAAEPLQKAYAAAEKAAKEAEAKAKAASDAANKPANEAKRAEAQAAAVRRGARAAGAALARARQGEEKLRKQVEAAAKKLAEAKKGKESADAASAEEAEDKVFQAEDEKELLDAALAAVRKQVAAAVKASQAAEQAASTAEKSAQDKKKAAAEAAARRKASADAEAAVAQARKARKQAQAAAATKGLTEVQNRKKSADAALEKAKKQLTEVGDPKDDTAKAARAKAEQGVKAAEAAAANAAKELAASEAKKKSADGALADAKKRLADAQAAAKAAQEAAGGLLELDAAAKAAASDAAAKRKAANTAKAALTPKQKALEQATIKARSAADALNRAEARKKSAEAGLDNLKKQIAAAKQTHVADEEAAKQAEAAAAPLKVEAQKARDAYSAARKVADEKQALVQQAKGQLYRLIAAGRIAKLMESPDPPKPANRIDEIVFAKLKTLGVKPALCSDAVFIRRAFLDLTGKLPSADEAKAFIQSKDPKKRVALIDRLLEDPDHFDYWAMKWSDILRIKAEFPVKVWPNAAQAYHRWVWESIAQNKPYDRFVRELLTSSGSNFRVGPVNFYRAIQNKTPEGIAAAVGLAFMGTRTHVWPEDRRAGMAAFFSQVGYKPTSEWKEEIIFWDPLKSTAVPGSIAPGIPDVAKGVTATNQIPQALAKPIAPNGPLAAVFPDGAKTSVPPDRDPREAFADWLIRPENPYFAKAIVNRTWAWAMGRGIIHEADDIREDNPPSNPELLAYLEKELASNGYDLKHLKRLIFTSTVYQFSSLPKSDKPEAAANFASYRLRRVEAEVLNDMVNEITGSTDLYTSAVPEPFTYIPKDMVAVEVADGSISSPFLTLFGRSARATGMENERVNELASSQWLYMLNSATMQGKLQNGPKLRAMVSGGGTSKIAERLYLAILSRLPTDADIQAAEAHAKAKVAKGRDVWIDLAWALINSPEFLLRH